MIIVTGGAGFIGSAIVWRLNTRNITDILIVDELGTTDKWKNLVGLKYSDYINKTEFIENIKLGVNYDAEAIIHMGANSSTTERDADHLMSNNFEYTKTLAQYCVENNVRFIYASSAATYGDGNLGFVDDENKLETLRPLNMYGYSKALFDIWAKNNKMLDKIVGIKYFNVYGPNEYHKGDMRSVVHKAYQQILETGKVVLFKSDRPDYKDGEQKRDFVYVKDAVDMTLYFLDNKNKNGIYNVGSGNARTWNDLVGAIFTAIGKKKNIEYIDMPKHLAAKYQYFTQAELGKIKAAGYASPVTSLEEGVGDYVKNYLIKDRFLE
ncbi:MAG TPA: ADP-glyceromanno-heptose 6-epimerase [Ignavibacteriaceae bacterium]|nr:ADP-glyceromanno-heptose 6-epimerase [Ignavibacteriaceae bacterium]